MNFFDAIAERAFDIITDTLGVDAVWNGKGQTVIYKSPTGKQAIQEVDFDPTLHKIEYRAGVFTGLKESVDDGNTETILINNNPFYVVDVKRLFDGFTYMATLREG